MPRGPGGLPIPRPPAETRGGTPSQIWSNPASIARIKTTGEWGRYKENEDVTHHFLTGAQKVLQIALENGVRYAILKERSPSCGIRQIYVDGELASGPGLTSAALQSMGVQVIAGDDFE